MFRQVRQPVMDMLCFVGRAVPLSCCGGFSMSACMMDIIRVGCWQSRQLVAPVKIKSMLLEATTRRRSGSIILGSTELFTPRIVSAGGPVHRQRPPVQAEHHFSEGVVLLREPRPRSPSRPHLHLRTGDTCFVHIPRLPLLLERSGSGLCASLSFLVSLPLPSPQAQPLA